MLSPHEDECEPMCFPFILKVNGHSPHVSVSFIS